MLRTRNFLDDPDFLEIADSAIAKGKSAAFAWKTAAKLHAERLAALRNELLAQRANDVRDVGLRVLGLLTGSTQMSPQYPEHSVLIAEDLTPSDTATMEGGTVARSDAARVDGLALFVSASHNCTVSAVDRIGRWGATRPA